MLAIASLLFVGCNKNEFSPAKSEGSRVVTITASLDVTKVGVGESAGKFAWEEGDVVGVWTGAEFTPFTIEPASVGAVAGKFTGTIPEGGSLNENSYAVYPYCAADTFEGTNYTSKYEDNNWEFKSLVPMAAKPDADGNYKFGHLTALAYLKIRNIPVEAKSIFFESTKQLFFISGTADLAAEYPKFEATETADYCFMDIPAHDAPIDMTVFVPLVMGEFSDPKFRFTLFSCTTGDDFDWGAEMDKATYNHYGFLNTGGYINRGNLFVLPEVNFGGSDIEINIDGDFSDWDNAEIATLSRTDDMTYKVLKTIKYYADAGYMYVYMELEGTKQYGNIADFNVMMDFYIDEDGDPATGGVRADVFNHGVSWYYETFVGDANSFGSWNSGQYEYTGVDGGGVFSSLNNHNDEYHVDTAGTYDPDADFAQIEARFKRSDFKLTNPKAGFGMAILDGSEAWELMGKLPQNSDNSLFIMDMPEYFPL